MIKILHVISDTGIGGAGVHLCNLLATTDRNRFALFVALPRESLLVPRLRALGVSVILLRHGADSSADLRAIPEVMRTLRRIRPHVLHTHSALYARIAGGLLRVPVAVNTRHCADENERPSFVSKQITRLLERCLRTHTIATAHYVRKILIRRGVSPHTITVILNGSRPQPLLSPQERAQLRDTLGIEPSAFAVGMVARLAVGKGHETFLRAARLCLEKDPGLCFLIVGSGDREPHLKKMANSLGLTNQVRFLGFRNDVGRIMNLLDVNVNCSERSETSSLSLSEGMCVGAVPVVTDCGGNPEMAGFGESGVIFSVGDHQSLARVLLALKENPARRNQLSQNCRRHFSEHFTAEGMTEKTESLYQSLLKKHFLLTNPQKYGSMR